MSGAQFWRLDTPGGELALRRWPTEHPSPERLRFIHSVLEHAGCHGIVILPIPIKSRAGQSFIQHDGHLWELEPWMPGTADYERSPTSDKLRNALQALGNIHLVLGSFPQAATGHRGAAVVEVAGAAPSITRRLARLRELHAGGQQELARAITDANWPDLAPLARRFLSVVPAVLRPAIAQLEPLAGVALPLQPCLRDIWHDHVLFSGAAVTGVIDCGAVDIDTPACDIARLLGSLVGDGVSDWQTGIAAYSAVRQLSAAELQAVAALDLSGTLLAGCNWIRWIYGEGRRFENPAQVVRRFRTILERAGRAEHG
jgi:Ser/Thr protein kinase RdoA (MazF antagonist)